MGIRWKQSDFIKLGKAIKSYNRKIEDLQDKFNEGYLPSLIDYKEAKTSITTRKELNRLLNSLKQFQKEGAEDLYVTEGRIYDDKMGT